MFFVKTLQKELLLHPQYFGPNLKEIIANRLVQEVEGASLGDLGFVITVTSIFLDELGHGAIEDDTGYVSFMVSYQAVLFRPFKNEVLDAVVTVVTKLGFFCEAGPLKIFVSRHNMPDDLADGYDPTLDTWTSGDKEVEIKAGYGVRLRLIGISIDAAEISAIGTIKDDYLGLISAEVA